MTKLDLGIIQDAFMFPFRNFGAVLRLGMFPVLILLTAAHILFSLSLPLAAELPIPRRLTAALIMLPMLLVHMIAVSIPAVGIYRLILRDEKPGWVIFRLGRYERAHVMGMLLFLCLAVTAQILFTAINRLAELAHSAGLGFAPVVGLAFVALSVAALVASLLVFIRLVLALPHAAVAGELSLNAPLNAVDCNLRRFAAAFLILNGIAAVTSFIVVAPIMALGASSTQILVAPDYGPWFLTVRAIMLMPALLLILAMLVALLAYAYKQLAEGRGAEARHGLESDGRKSVDEWSRAAISHL
jgi:hypothetical protein